MLPPAVRTLCIILAFLALLGLFCYRLDAIGLTGPDEPRYAEVAKEMFLTRDYVTPRLMGQPWFEKPALYYWGAAVSYAVLGINETGARMPSALAAWLLVLAIFYVPRQILSFKTRTISALIFATSLGTLAFSHAASTDMLLTSTFSIAVLFLWAELHQPQGNRFSLSLLIAYVMLGLSVLAKGPVGVLLTILILAVYLVVTRRWEVIRRLHLPVGIFVMLVVAVPWYWLCYQANGWAFIDTFIVQHNLMRFATNEFKHSRPFWFYIPVVLGSLLPWSFFLVLPGTRTRKLLQPFYWKNHPQTTFLLLWVLIPFLFFTMAESKLPGYILPALIPLSIVIAQSLSRESQSDAAAPRSYRPSTLMRWSYLLEIFFFAGLLVFHRRIILRFNLPLDGLARWFAVVCCAAIVALVYCSVSKRGFWIFIVGQAVLMAALVMLTSHTLLPRFDADVSSRPMAQIIRLRSSQPAVFLYDVPREAHYGLDYYLDPAPIVVPSCGDIQEQSPKGDYFVVLPPKMSLTVLNTLPAEKSLLLQSTLGQVVEMRPH